MISRIAVPARVRVRVVMALSQRMRDLDIGPFGHGPLLRRPRQATETAAQQWLHARGSWRRARLVARVT